MKREENENSYEEENESEEIIADDEDTNNIPDIVESITVNKVIKRKSLSDNIQDIPEDSPPVKVGRIDPILEDAGNVDTVDTNGTILVEYMIFVAQFILKM